MIARMLISNFMGIAAAEYELPPGGAVISGGNGAGKTSVLRAVRAALSAQGIGADAIRQGADSAEILVDLDDLTVRRAITRKGSSLTVTRGGARQSSPQTLLTTLLGMSPLDPLELFLESNPKRRRARILEALPILVSAEQLQRWCPPDADLGLYLGRTPGGAVNVEGHGLEVVDRLRRAFYDSRAAANKEVETRQKDYDAAVARALAAKAGLNNPGAKPDSREENERRLVAANAARSDLLVRESAARSAEERATKHSARVQELRTQAEDLRALADAEEPSTEEIAATCAAVDASFRDSEEAAEIVEALELELERAREARLAADGKQVRAIEARRSLTRRQEQAGAKLDRARSLEQQAAELAAAIAAPADRPTPAELEKASLEIQAAEAQVVRSAAWAAAQAAHDAAAQARSTLVIATTKAETLDATVKRLANDAPAALLASADGIPGLAVDGENVLLDGVAIDRLSSAEQLRFAVEVARRLNARSKLLVVDGLERLDAEQLPRFLELATRDGYQVLATRVTSGPAVAEPIESAAREP